MAGSRSKNNPSARNKEKALTPSQALAQLRDDVRYVGKVFLFPDGKSFKEFKYASAYDAKRRVA